MNPWNCVWKVVLVETAVPQPFVAGGRASAASDAEHNMRVASQLTSAGLQRVVSLGNRVNHAYVRSDVLQRCRAVLNETSCSRTQVRYQLAPMRDCRGRTDSMWRAARSMRTVNGLRLRR